MQNLQTNKTNKMKITVYDERKDVKKQINVSSIREAAEKLNINLEEVIIIKNNKLVTETSKLKDKDELKFLSVISGGWKWKKYYCQFWLQQY